MAKTMLAHELDGNVVSVNVGLPRTVRWKGRDVTTGIFKEPVEGRVAVRRLNLDGDGQADLSVHGGATKAVYAYRSSTTRSGAVSSGRSCRSAPSART
jgi:MOSC domain-containing protein YiiM